MLAEAVPVLAEAVRAVLAGEPVAGHPATELALVSALWELSGLTADAVNTLAAVGGLAVLLFFKPGAQPQK